MAEDYNSIGFKNADIDKLKSIMSNFDKSGNKTESVDVKKSNTEEPKKQNTEDPGKEKITRTEVKNPNGSTTYKMNWSSDSSNKKPANTPNKKPTNTPNKKSASSNNKKSTDTNQQNSNAKSGSREITTIIPMSKGIVNGENKMTAPLSAANLVNRGDNRTWQQKRKDEVTKRDYNRYRQGDETVSEWKERSKKASEEVSRKAPDRTSRKVFSRPGSGSGGCKSC